MPDYQGSSSSAATGAASAATAATQATTAATQSTTGAATGVTILDQEERAVATASATALTNGATLFTIAGGSIIIVDLMSECITVQQAVATTLQYSSSPTVGSATTISGATTTLSGVAAGTTVRLAPTALSTAPVISLAAAGGVQLGTNVANRIIVNPGTITSTVTNAGTGTWKTYLRYQPLRNGVTVTG